MVTARKVARRDETPRRADAERNIAAIIAAGLALFSRDAEVSMADIAKAAGFGRVTVYAHFPSRAELLQELVAQSIAQAQEAMDREPQQPGERADVVLTRLLGVSWQVLDRHRNLRAAAMMELGPAKLSRSHDPVRGRVKAVIEAGRQQGVFREDLPVDWLVTLIFGIVHTAADEVQAGRLAQRSVPKVLNASILSALRP